MLLHQLGLESERGGKRGKIRDRDRGTSRQERERELEQRESLRSL